MPEHTNIKPRDSNAREVFAVFLRLGLTSFGGPIAHIGYFRNEIVERRKWISEPRFGQLLALCQFLPGPASSQLAFVLGLLRAGWLGALAAFAAFTLPSATLLIALACIDIHTEHPLGLALVQGLKLTAVCVVAHAVYAMSQALPRRTWPWLISIASAITMLFAGPAWMQVVVIACAMCVGALILPKESRNDPALLVHGPALSASLIALAIVLLAIALVATDSNNKLVSAAAGFYRAGALVFGGGHVVLPLLKETVVESGWLDADSFMSGYGLAQIIPGPMFSLAAYLGAKMAALPGALVCLLAIFLPGLLLVAGALPFWESLSSLRLARGIFSGANAAVIGILAAALYDPVWTTSVHTIADAGIALIGFALLIALRKLSPAWAALWCIGAAQLVQYAR